MDLEDRSLLGGQSFRPVATATVTVFDQGDEQSMSGYTNFTCNSPGQNSHATTGAPGLQPGQSATINGDGNSDLSSYIQFNDNGRVFGITLVSNPGIYDYSLHVDAQGPSGFGSGSGYLAFTDDTGDTYKLSIYSSTRSVHTVAYNSQKPGIVKIQWSDTSI